MEETMVSDLLSNYCVRILYRFLLELTTLKMLIKSSLE